MLDLLTGGWVAQTLRATAELNIADHLADGPATAEQVAEREGSDPRTTYRLMRAASSPASGPARGSPKWWRRSR
ncbi:methyltransferase dimerization domain-containing protein [Amycolatopsis sp. NPDC050768]|uniref:methyltransferase family protein n=1 Tax=Amycolatopsis sp. NPDC050768 TaxID=3154839 RepID=UPI0033DF4729